MFVEGESPLDGLSKCNYGQTRKHPAFHHPISQFNSSSTNKTHSTNKMTISESTMFPRRIGGCLAWVEEVKCRIFLLLDKF